MAQVFKMMYREDEVLLVKIDDLERGYIRFVISNIKNLTRTYGDIDSLIDPYNDMWNSASYAVIYGDSIHWGHVNYSNATKKWVGLNKYMHDVVSQDRILDWYASYILEIELDMLGE